MAVLLALCIVYVGAFTHYPTTACVAALALLFHGIHVGMGRVRGSAQEES